MALHPPARAVILLMGVLFSGCEPAPRTTPGSGEYPPAAGALVQHTVESDGHLLAVWGRSPAEPHQVALLLHGRTWSSLPDFDLGTGDSHSLMEALSTAGVATYALDARGYGATPRDPSGWIDPDRMARDVRNVLQWLTSRHPGLRPPVVLGWSFGSAVGHLAAQRWPEELSGIALYGYFKHPDRIVPAGETPLDPPRAANTEAAARSDFIAPGAISESDVAAFVRAALEADPVRVDVRAVEQLNALSPDSLTVPTLILQGELDPIGPTAVQEVLFRRLGTAHKAWVVLPGCDHAAHLEVCRGRFQTTLLRFIREVG